MARNMHAHEGRDRAVGTAVEKMFLFWLRQAKGFPEEDRIFMSELIYFYRKFRYGFRASVDDGYRKMKEFLSDGHE